MGWLIAGILLAIWLHSRRQLKALTEFVATGGAVVAFAKCGMINERSWYWRDRPGGLTRLFGVKETQIAKSERVVLVPQADTVVFDGVTGPVMGHWHRQEFAPR